MFNFFTELKSKYKSLSGRQNAYQCVLIGDYLLYVEGYKGLLTLSEDVMVFKVSGGVITVEGQNLNVEELLENTISISGKINRIERI